MPTYKPRAARILFAAAIAGAACGSQPRPSSACNPGGEWVLGFVADDSVVAGSGSLTVRGSRAIVDVDATFREGYGEPITDSAAIVLARGDSIGIRFAAIGYQLDARCRQANVIEGRFSVPLTAGGNRRDRRPRRPMVRGLLADEPNRPLLHLSRVP